MRTEEERKGRGKGMTKWGEKWRSKAKKNEKMGNEAPERRST